MTYRQNAKKLIIKMMKVFLMTGMHIQEENYNEDIKLKEDVDDNAMTVEQYLAWDHVIHKRRRIGSYDNVLQT